VKKVRVGSKVRRVYDAPKTPFERVVASKQGDAIQLTLLQELQRSLDPFQSAKVIDRKLARIYRLANRRLSPQAQENLESRRAKQVGRGRRKGCGKDARFASLKIPKGFSLSHSHNSNKRSPVTYQMARHEKLLPVVEKALETAGLMLGTNKSRGYCLEMICADFLAGANLAETQS